jgi:hypothetical protein
MRSISKKDWSKIIDFFVLLTDLLPRIIAAIAAPIRELFKAPMSWQRRAKSPDCHRASDRSPSGLKQKSHQ